MGLTSWKYEKIDGKVLKSDMTVAKNYLNEKELGDLNHFVSQYLDYAEGLARRKIGLTMKDWVDKLDAFLKFRVIQDKEYQSDFDRFSQTIDEIKTTGKLPSPKISLGFSVKEFQEKQKLSDFNQNLNKE
jgi:hypothetical protein